MQKAIIYCRTATSEQNRKSGIKRQENKCLKAAKKQGYKVSDVIKDEGMGGHNLRPKKLQQK